MVASGGTPVGSIMFERTHIPKEEIEIELQFNGYLSEGTLLWASIWDNTLPPDFGKIGNSARVEFVAFDSSDGTFIVAYTGGTNIVMIKIRTTGNHANVEINGKRNWAHSGQHPKPVSYTHLTLPTKA